jgi:transcriptional regulator with GAF, ATPase, and Fis domain
MTVRPPEAQATTEILVRDGDRLKLRTRTIHLDILGGPNAGQSANLVGPEARVGSGPGCQLTLLDPAVSRHHLTLRVERGRVRVVDAGSSNGTTLDGVVVHDAYARTDSTLVVGNTTLRLRLADGLVDLPISAREQFGALIGKSVAMRLVFTILERVAATDEVVLLEGETGTGKDLCAEAIHEESPRAAGPFVIFDCSAVSPTLIESELFGHVRGAFTGAIADRTGAFEAAAEGTLFLDEVGELPLEMQPKLLRVLERREVRRVGSNEVRKVDARIVAATNKTLSEEVGAGRFREDLYYRLAVVPVRLPPLRERTDDIPFLVERFAAGSAQGPGRTLDERWVKKLAAQAWPGNLRELRNAVARALSLGVAGTSNRLLESGAHGSPVLDLSVPLKAARDRGSEAFEEAYLREALRQTGGNATRAAELAGVNRKFVQRAIKRYGLRDDGEKD